MLAILARLTPPSLAVTLPLMLAATALQIINTRSNLLGASRVLDDIALDKYSFLRDAYLQRRRSLVFDGNEPPPDNPLDPEPSASAPAAK